MKLFLGLSLVIAFQANAAMVDELKPVPILLSASVRSSGNLETSDNCGGYLSIVKDTTTQKRVLKFSGTNRSRTIFFPADGKKITSPRPAEFDISNVAPDEKIEVKLVSITGKNSCKIKFTRNSIQMMRYQIAPAQMDAIAKSKNADHPGALRNCAGEISVIKNPSTGTTFLRLTGANSSNGRVYGLGESNEIEFDHPLEGQGSQETGQAIFEVPEGQRLGNVIVQLYDAQAKNPKANFCQMTFDLSDKTTNRSWSRALGL